MEMILNDIVDPNDLKKFRKMYEEQASRGSASEKAQFEYAICLVRSRPEVDMRHGISLLEDLIRRTQDGGTRRDCLYYLAIGLTRVKEYPEALKYTKAFLQIEPMNHQVQQLQKHIKDKMNKEGLVGMAIVGGAALALGGLVGLGVALAKK